MACFLVVSTLISCLLYICHHQGFFSAPFKGTLIVKKNNLRNNLHVFMFICLVFFQLNLSFFMAAFTINVNKQNKCDVHQTLLQISKTMNLRRTKMHPALECADYDL